ncbi:MAG TPA: hypothetical protein VM030_06020 [Acidimicrobiales bacterium]|nr:hypothetical protein [Acidimicrobiales bacterium]
MDATFRTRLAFPPAAVAPVVADLGSYPGWLGIVHAAVPDAGADGERAWLVDLGASIGPLRRTKRVRMVRTSATQGGARFERDERDGRDHPSWVLEAELVPDGADGTDLVMRLHYGGAPQLPLLDVVLGQQAARAGARLEQVLRDAAD